MPDGLGGSQIRVIVIFERVCSGLLVIKGFGQWGDWAVRRVGELGEFYLLDESGASHLFKSRAL